jgi:hypothetical protein
MTQNPAHVQSTNSVLMIRPYRFYSNPETAADNAFQRDTRCGSDTLTPAARKEFDAAGQTLRAAGVNMHVFEDTAEPEKPDAVFPNNWISTHHDGRIALFPMYSALRRRERRQDIIEKLRKEYRVTEVIDYSAFEEEGCCLEGTGSLVLDHVNKIAYVSLSSEGDPTLCEGFQLRAGHLYQHRLQWPANLSHQCNDVHRNGVRDGWSGDDCERSRAATGASALGERRKGDR